MDLFMKSYEEMAHSVQKRAKAYELIQKRRRRVAVRAAVAASCCICTVVAVIAGTHGFTHTSIAPPSTASDTLSTVERLTMLQHVYLSGGAVITEDLLTAQELPMRYKILVMDKRQPQMVEDYEAGYAMLTKERLSWTEQYADEGAAGAVTQYENVTVAALSMGQIRLQVQAPEQVASIRAACRSGYGKAEMALCADSLAGQEIAFDLQTEAGKTTLKKRVYDSGLCWLYGQDITLQGDTYAAVTAQEQGDFFLRWKPSVKMNEVLNKEPSTPLSAFFDRMTVTVNYKNGTAERFCFSILFSDDGDVCIRYDGTE